jgi:hypothetical protein
MVPNPMVCDLGAQGKRRRGLVWFGSFLPVESFAMQAINVFQYPNL